MATLTKHDLIIRISKETGLVQRQVLDLVQKTLDSITDALAKGDVKAGVRTAVKTVLRKRGVKPEHLKALTRQVIIQAEAMFKEWPLAA